MKPFSSDSAYFPHLHFSVLDDLEEWGMEEDCAVERLSDSAIRASNEMEFDIASFR
jgi:hypothetical protein